MGHSEGLHAGTHKVVQFAGLSFNMDTLYATWICMAIVILLAYISTRNLSLVPRGWQNFLEIIVTAILEQIQMTIGPKGKKVVPLLITLFLFLVICNEVGLIPVPIASPTADLNTTAGLALLVAFLVHMIGVWEKGFMNYIKHFFQPFAVFVIINIIEEVAKPVTLAFRLFGNILAGEILLEILGMLSPWLVPTLWLGFSVFIGVVQGVIFMMLSLSYLSNSLKEEAH